LRGLFVTGTDTGVGKSVLAAVILAALRARGTAVKTFKPVITGLDEPPELDWPPDHELLARAAGCDADRVVLAGYCPPVSPHLAAELAGRPVRPGKLVATILGATREDEALIVEGVGGLLVPIADGYDVRRLALDLGLPILIAARPGLGTINHTLLTLEAARQAGLDVAGVVLTPWPEAPGEIERSNRTTIERLGKVAVSALARIERADVELLATAGERLPLDDWLD
jgi:dethiobiotin synthetase